MYCKNQCINNKNKRNYSTFSISSKLTEKRSKVFSSPNLLSVLAMPDKVNANIANIRCSKTHNSDVSTKPQPVYIKNVFNFSNSVSRLLTILDFTESICKSTPSYIIVYTQLREHFNSLIVHRKENDDCFHTCQPNAIHMLRVVIRNIHPTTSHEDIIAGLAELVHNVTNIRNIKLFLDKAPSPLFSLISKNLPTTWIFKRLSSFSTLKSLLKNRGLQKVHHSV